MVVQCHRSNLNESRHIDNLRVANLQAEVWRDDFGRSHAENEHLKLTNKELLKSMPALIDSIKRDFRGVKPKTITKVITITETIHDTVKFPIGKPFSFHYKDKWNEYKITPDSLLSITVRDSLALVDSKKRYGFLNLKSKYTVEAISYNPKATLTGLRSIEIIPDEPRRFGLSVTAGPAITNLGFGYGVVAGLSYRIF